MKWRKRELTINYLDVLNKYEKLIMEDPKYYDKLQLSYARLCMWQEYDFCKRWSLVKED